MLWTYLSTNSRTLGSRNFTCREAANIRIVCIGRDIRPIGSRDAMGNDRLASIHSACSLSLRLCHCFSNSGRYCSDNSMISFKTLLAGEPRTISTMSEASIKKWTLTSHSPRRLAWKWGGSWSLDQNQSLSPEMENALTIAKVTIHSYRTFVKYGVINLSGCVPNEGSLLRLVLLTATRGRVLGLNWIGVGSLVPRILVHSGWLSKASST